MQYELDKAREKRQAEAAKQDVAELLARCKELMGEKQTNLFERQVSRPGPEPSFFGRLPVLMS